jgi:hypothetical protein
MPTTCKFGKPLRQTYTMKKRWFPILLPHHIKCTLFESHPGWPTSWTNLTWLDSMKKHFPRETTNFGWSVAIPNILQDYALLGSQRCWICHFWTKANIGLSNRKYTPPPHSSIPNNHKYKLVPKSKSLWSMNPYGMFNCLRDCFKFL